MLGENRLLEKLLRIGRKIIPKPVFNFFQPFYHFLLGFCAAILYGFPGKKLIVIGVTGTKGKSTVVYLTHELLQKAGLSVASISSVEFRIKDKSWNNPLKMTMPGRFKIQKFFKQALDSGCKYMILEVTSEGIKQFRHKFINFNAVAYTNLAKEHLESHHGFENYKKAKGKLFKELKKSNKKDKFLIVNKDDKYSEYYSNLAGKVKKYEYTFENLELKLLGDFNKYNALAGINICIGLGLDKNKLYKDIKNIKGLPGRMELIIKKPFKVFIDYAHTPDSLEAVYKTLGKGLICVLGSAGGGRDKWKRPEMGKIADKYCDKIILTNEDPYNEDPKEIIKDVAKGIKKDYKIILDRREAIKKALSYKEKTIITGKGSEILMCVKDKKIPWSDKKIVLEEYEKSFGSKS
ncbi:UDP-N-acetylmuramoyl-L-alanyl-D-glutamate--2,6-diaminopimelate ligase [Patescibacteria group bacterium]|nr:UDP-N-acetylmuramoyl-L-alanyl-D-glutamate--2,6-diaminopimelate ligase [Patescibacteria group bacterium]